MVIRMNPSLLNIQREKNPSGGRDKYMRLDKNERTVTLESELNEGIMEHLNSTSLTVYPEMDEIQSIIARKTGVEEESILLTAGLDAGIAMCFHSFVEENTEVVFPAPTFAMVEVYARLVGAKPTPVRYDDTLSLDCSQICESVNNATRLVYIANPNSPTGTELSIDQLHSILKVTEELGVVTLIDEAYFPFHKETALPLTKIYSNLLVGRSFSKAMGLAGVRGGYLLGNPDMISLVAQWRPMYEINTLAVVAGIEVMKRWNDVERYASEVRTTRKWFQDQLKARGFITPPSATNFILVKFPGRLIKNAVDYYKLKGILIKSGGRIAPLCEMLRFTIGSSDQMKNCIVIFDEFCSSNL